MSHLTSAQKGYVRNLLRRAEFDTNTVTLMYRRLGVTDSWQGCSVEAWLDSLPYVQVQGLITKLKDILGEEDDDED